MACQYAVDSLSQMVQTRLVAPSEAEPDAAEEVAVEAAVELNRCRPQAASAAAPGNNGAGLQERTAGNLSHGVCLLEIFFFFFKTGGPHDLHAPASLPIL